MCTHIVQLHLSQDLEQEGIQKKWEKYPKSESQKGFQNASDPNQRVGATKHILSCQTMGTRLTMTMTTYMYYVKIAFKSK